MKPRVQSFFFSVAVFQRRKNEEKKSKENVCKISRSSQVYIVSSIIYLSFYLHCSIFLPKSLLPSFFYISSLIHKQNCIHTRKLGKGRTLKLRIKASFQLSFFMFYAWFYNIISLLKIKENIFFVNQTCLFKSQNNQNALKSLKF